MMLALSMVIALFALQGDSPKPVRKPVRSVPAVDLERYAGLWYEVARFPNSFQAKCRGQATATYERLPGGELRVVNICRGADGRMIRTEGRARLADRAGPPSRLKVRFAPAILSFLPMVWGDYWILDLTADYGAALVGTPSREYLWVLSRTPQLEDTIFQRLIATAAAQGFDVARLARFP
jgi:apolipoprotein D and lipocalin family protein